MAPLRTSGAAAGASPVRSVAMTSFALARGQMGGTRYGRIAPYALVKASQKRSPMRSLPRLGSSLLSGLRCWPALAAVAALGTLAAPAHADELKIGFVSTERIMRESAAAKAAEVRLTQEFAARDKELQELGAKLKAASDKLDKDGPVLSEADRSRQQRELQEMDREFQRRRREFQEDLNQRKNEELQSLLERAQKIVRQIAEQEKYDVILQDAVYVGPRADVTDKVLKTLDAQK